MVSKQLVAAIGLAMSVAGTAHAAISDGNESIAGRGVGELFVTVYDPVGVKTYTKDLGINVFGPTAPNFNTTTQDFVINDATFTSSFASTAGLQYAVLGASSITNPLNAGAGLGVFVTSNAPANGPGGLLAYDTANNYTNPYGAIAAYVADTNGGSTNFAANVVNGISGNARDGAFGGAQLTNGTLGGSLPGAANVGATFGTALSFYKLSVDINDGSNVNAKFANSWKLALNAADGLVHLTYGATGPVVPLPPAVWLLGSALLGLVNIARRRTA